MGENIILDGIINKVPQVKETVEKIKEATGKKIENVACEVGGKITDAIKEQGGEDPKEVFENLKDKLFMKKD